MRDFQPWLVHGLAAVEEQVEIDRARPEARAGAVSPELAFDVLKPLEQRPRRKLRAKRRGAVQKPRLVEVADRVGLAERRDRQNLDPTVRFQSLERLADGPLAVAEVRTEAHVDNRHCAANFAYTCVVWGSSWRCSRWLRQVRRRQRPRL